MFTHPTQQFHIRYIYFDLVLVFHQPKLHFIQRCWSLQLSDTCFLLNKVIFWSNKVILISCKNYYRAFLLKKFLVHMLNSLFNR